MRKRKIIGSILFIILILLIPSIPAIQQDIIEEKAYNDLVEKIEDVDLEVIEHYLQKNKIRIRPILSILWFWAQRRCARGILLELISVDGGRLNNVIFPLIYQRSLWLQSTAYMFIIPINHIFELYGYPISIVIWELIPLLLNYIFYQKIC